MEITHTHTHTETQIHTHTHTHTHVYSEYTQQTCNIHTHTHTHVYSEYTQCIHFTVLVNCNPNEGQTHRCKINSSVLRSPQGFLIYFSSVTTKLDASRKMG